MPLILAVEPDRRQAAQLTGIIRQHVGAELILAETTEGALGAIGRRVPDLVLVPALLAPQDDAALASALRVIAAAAHVRTLTIPVFANGVSHKKRSGMFARLGLGREDNKVPEGCEPSVFAEQVIAYLREAAAERAASEPAEEPVYAATTAEPDEPPEFAGQPAYESVAAETPQAELPEAAEAASYDEVASVLFEPPAPVPEPFAEADAHDDQTAVPPLLEERAEISAAALGDQNADEDDGIDLSDELLNLSEEGDEQLDTEDVAIYSIDVMPEDLFAEDATAELEAFIDTPAPPAASLEPDALAETTPPLEALAAADAPQAAESVEPDAIAELQAALEEPLPLAADQGWDEPVAFEEDASEDEGVELWMPLPQARRWPALHGMVSEPRPIFTEGFHEKDFVREPHVAASAPLEPTAPMPAPPAAPAMAPAAASASDARSSEWVELIESLRLDIERLKTAPPAAEKPRAAAAVKQEPAAKPAKRAAKRAQPIQDEWGFFDPEQCGFAALLAKLDEITDNPDDPSPRNR